VRTFISDSPFRNRISKANRHTCEMYIHTYMWIQRMYTCQKYTHASMHVLHPICKYNAPNVNKYKHSGFTLMLNTRVNIKHPFMQTHTRKPARHIRQTRRNVALCASVHTNGYIICTRTHMYRYMHIYICTNTCFYIHIIIVIRIIIVMRNCWHTCTVMVPSFTSLRLRVLSTWNGRILPALTHTQI